MQIFKRVDVDKSLTALQILAIGLERRLTSEDDPSVSEPETFATLRKAE